jgi:hypothetical protein
LSGYEVREFITQSLLLIPRNNIFQPPSRRRWFCLFGRASPVTKGLVSPCLGSLYLQQLIQQLHHFLVPAGGGTPIDLHDLHPCSSRLLAKPRKPILITTPPTAVRNDTKRGRKPCMGRCWAIFSQVTSISLAQA